MRGGAQWFYVAQIQHELAGPPRVRSAADVVNQIANAEADIAAWECQVDDLISAGEPYKCERATVHILKQRCVSLRQSRALLSAEV